MTKQAIRNIYVKEGVESYYLNHADEYENPHESIIKELLSNYLQLNSLGSSVLDLCCGNGLVTKAIADKVPNIIGCDPYMTEQYRQQTGRKCYEYDFLGLSQEPNLPKVDTVICSFALHLCPASLLPAILYNLSQISDKLIAISPNKRPHIQDFWELEDVVIHNRVRMMIFKKK